MADDRYWWDGQYRTAHELYGKGMDDERKRSNTKNRASIQGVADEIKRMILTGSSTMTEQASDIPTWWPQFTRASEHIVHDVTGAPANSGEYQVSPYDQVETTSVISESWIVDAMPILQYTRMIEAMTGQPIPKLPYLATAPTAGTRTGEKQAMYSKAFDIVDATDITIEAGLYLNISQVLIDAGFGPLTNTIMRAAVAAEASRQIAQAIEAAAGAGGMANFTGNRYVPKVVVVPPDELATINAANFVAAGMTVVIDTQVSQTLVVDPNSIIGWFRQGKVEQMEPAQFGTGLAFMTYGKVAVDPAGVATLASTP